MPPIGYWCYVPKSEQRPHRVAIRIVRGHREWTGSWTVMGDVLVVLSLNGCRTLRLGAELDPAIQAEALLSEIVDARARW
jgi:hypothetical protein